MKLQTALTVLLFGALLLSFCNLNGTTLTENQTLPNKMHTNVRNSDEDVYEKGPDMNFNRMEHHQVTLPNGKIVLFGGHGTSFTALDTSEIYDPETNSFTTYSMNSPHDQPGFAKLNDGRYLIAGGSTNSGIPRFSASEIFNPETFTFTTVGSMNLFRANPGSVALKNGKVLVVGAWYNHNEAHTYGELFDPETGTFSKTAAFNIRRTEPMLIPLNDGRALIFGGRSYGFGTFSNPPVETFDPDTGEIEIKQALMILDHPGWYVASLLHLPELQLLQNGQYLFLANKIENEISYYELITVDPETGDIDFFETNGLPNSETHILLRQPLITADKQLAYIMATTKDEEYKTITLFTVDLETGDVFTTGEEFELDYHTHGMVFSLTNDGRIFCAGGSTRTDYYTNFYPTASTFFITPAIHSNADTPTIAVNKTLLKGNYPNPFNPTTTIEFSVVEPSDVTIEIYNILGQKVKTLTSSFYNSGDHQLVWNGKDDNGRDLASGIYFSKMSTPRMTAIKKMVMMK
ncbi:MAG: FlgD immunoglobulin-like domain containing protein [Candidatus Cloacimonadia bacterium]